MVKFLETERLFLRPFTDDDVDSVFAMRADAELMRFIRAPQSERSEAKGWIDMISSRWATEKIGFCAVIEKTTSEFAGWCGLWRLRETGEIELGYALIAKFRGRGYACEAGRAFLEYGFATLGVDEIVAVASPENTGSRRVMERLGMTYDYTGRFYDNNLVHYSVSRAEFAKDKS